MYLGDQFRSLRSRLFHKAYKWFYLIISKVLYCPNSSDHVGSASWYDLINSLLQWWISWSHPSRTAYLSTPAYISKNKLDQKAVTGLSLPNADELQYTESLAMITKTVCHLPFELSKSLFSLSKKSRNCEQWGFVTPSNMRYLVQILNRD